MVNSTFAEKGGSIWSDSEDMFITGNKKTKSLAICRDKYISPVQETLSSPLGLTFAEKEATLQGYFWAISPNLSPISEQFSRMLEFLATQQKEAGGGHLYLEEGEIGVAYSWDCGGGMFLSPVFARRCSAGVGLVGKVMACGITTLLKHSHRPIFTKMAKQTDTGQKSIPNLS